MAFGLGEFPEFFTQFCRDPFFWVWPIEADAGGPALEILGTEEGGEATRNAVEATAAGGFFLWFELMPAVEDLGRGDDLFFTKDVGVAAD